MAHFFTADEKQFIKEHVHGISNAELTEMVNAHFSLDLTVNQIKNFKKNHKLNSGLNGRLKPGHIPINRVRKGVDGWRPSQFKKGHKPHNYMPVGSERVSDGYVYIKIADPKKWKGKHILIWEDHNGPVPKGHVVIFGDSNRRNFDINNLILVSRKQLVKLNQNNLIKDNADLTRTGIIIADIYSKIGERKKRK